MQDHFRPIILAIGLINVLIPLILHATFMFSLSLLVGIIIIVSDSIIIGLTKLLLLESPFFLE